jgi:uncharacterized YccA/Bax inhibitor family protein
MTSGVHTRLRSGNPALSSSVFEQRAGARAAGDVMTISGVVNKTAILLLLVVITATYAWTASAEAPQPGLMLVGGLGGLGVAFATIFKKTWAPYTAPLYALLEGLLLGGVSAIFERQYPGIVSQAIFLTFGVLGALLLAYRSGLIRATENFKLGVVAATGGILLVYLASFVLRLFGTGIPLIHESGIVGILFSLFVVTIAALNLVLDFDFIEQGAERQLPQYMDWYAGFGLLVTLVWLYLEILHLLAKLQRR